MGWRETAGVGDQRERVELMSEESLQHEGSRHADEVRITHVTKLADFERCVEIQLAVWGYAEGDLIPKRVFIVARSIGGQVIGAYADDVLVGFAMALPGYRDGHSYLHSHMLAVLPAYRNRGLGRRMKLAQRDDALARGFDLMEWTFDPLEIKNAHLNIARLGAIARRYIPDFYGPSTSPLQGACRRIDWWRSGGSGRSVCGEGWANCPARLYRMLRNPHKHWCKCTLIKKSSYGNGTQSSVRWQCRCRAATGWRLHLLCAKDWR